MVSLGAFTEIHSPRWNGVAMKLNLCSIQCCPYGKEDKLRVLKGRYRKKAPGGDLPSTSQAKNRNLKNMCPLQAFLPNSFSRSQPG